MYEEEVSDAAETPMTHGSSFLNFAVSTCAFPSSTFGAEEAHCSMTLSALGAESPEEPPPEEPVLSEDPVDPPPQEVLVTASTTAPVARRIFLYLMTAELLLLRGWDTCRH